MKAFLASMAVGVLFASTVALAGPKAGHPNLQAASKHLKMAAEKVSAAQTANEFDMEGHAAKAKELMAQAQTELDQAAAAANANKK
jgi:hypothetical protein